MNNNCQQTVNAISISKDLNIDITRLSVAVY